MDVPQARRLERPAWINARTVLGLLLFVIALLGTQRVIDASSVSTPVWTVRTDVPAGTVLAPTDVTLTEVNLPEDVLVHYAGASTSIAGAVVTRSVTAGEMVPLGALVAEDDAPGSRLLTVAVGDGTVTVGRIETGDVVDVYATFSAGEPGAVTRLLVSGVEVVEVLSTSSLVSGDDLIDGITLRLGAEDAARVAFAVRNAELDIARVTGELGETGTTEVNEGDLRR